MIDLNPFILSALVCAGLGVIAWIVSVVRSDAGIADVFWPWFAVVSALCYSPAIGSLSMLPGVLLGAITVSACRLSLMVVRRTRRAGEDRRYTDIRKNWGRGFALKSLPGIFLLQAAMGFILAMPLAFAMTRSGSPTPWDLFFGLLWLVGFLIQVSADRQLARFASNDDGSGVLQAGVWRYSRHPNYFGELCMAWAIFGLAALGGGSWTVFAPLLITWSILRFTGVSRMEEGISSRRPGYAAYARVTSPLIPWPPRKT